MLSDMILRNYHSNTFSTHTLGFFEPPSRLILGLLMSGARVWVERRKNEARQK